MAEELEKKLDGGGHPHPGYQYSPRFWRKRILKSGGSLYVNLPSAVLRDLGIAQHAEVLVYVVGRVICVQASKVEGFWPEVVSVRESGVGSRESGGAKSAP